MPLYDYGCNSCGREKEVQHPMSAIGSMEILCDDCGTQMEKLLSAPTLIGFDDVGRSIGKKERETDIKADKSKKQKDKTKESLS